MQTVIQTNISSFDPNYDSTQHLQAKILPTKILIKKLEMYKPSFHELCVDIHKALSMVRFLITSTYEEIFSS